MRPLLTVCLLTSLFLMTSGCGVDDEGKTGGPDPNPTAEGSEITSNETSPEKSKPEKPEPEKEKAKPKPKKPSLQVAEEFRFSSEPKIQLTNDELRDGWIQLFDGQTLFGWAPNNDANWHVTETGEIEASQGSSPGLLVTTVPFADYELRCDYWMSKGGNSGIFLRTPAIPTAPTKDCYELNICDSHPTFKTASLVGRAQPSTAVTGEETWKTFHVKVEGQRIEVTLDGESVLDFEDETEYLRTSGFIGLQQNEGLIRFRNVFLKPLGGANLNNGTNLANWHPVAGSQSSFDIDQEQIQVKGGSGFLETNDTWDDFVLQFEGRTNGAGLNGGVFFRLIPGTEEAPSHGYELQIEHVFLDDDRTKPKDDAGTGGIFRRSQARWVMPNDREDFYTTLIAYGPQISTWVNGIQMTDWKDTRKADDNPRRGSKVAAGPMSLQGHDDGTDISFGYFRVGTYPKGDAASLDVPVSGK